MPVAHTHLAIFQYTRVYAVYSVLVFHIQVIEQNYNEAKNI